MKKILLTASTTALLCGCGGPNYSITGNAGLEPGDSVFLIGSGRTELAAGVVCADSTIRLQGRVAEPEIARLANQERIPVGTAVIFLEPGDIRTVPTDDRRVYAVSGTPLNDKKREFDERMADFDRKFRELPPDAPADSLYAAYTKLVPDGVSQFGGAGCTAVVICRAAPRPFYKGLRRAGSWRRCCPKRRSGSSRECPERRNPSLRDCRNRSGR